MSWIAEYDTQGMEFPTCVHVTKTTRTMTHGATYVPIEEGKAVRVENAKLRELVRRMTHVLRADDEWVDPFYCNPYCADQFHCRSDDCVEVQCPIVKNMRELGVEV